ncbi:MAG: hypothetical protein C0490_24635, partial [Marivirga sp.]|nr:hypothetical protein [Marivirga sp.]
MDYIAGITDIHEARLFLICAGVFVFTAFAFMITILCSRIAKTYRTFRSKKLTEEFQKTVNALIILDHGKEYATQFSLAFHLKELRQKIGTSFRKQILVDLLVANKQNLTGTSADILKMVYVQLQLKKFSYSKLKSFYSLKKVQG